MTKHQCPINDQIPMTKRPSTLGVGHWCLIGHWFLVILLLAFATRASAQTTRPNIVLLIADDQSWLHTSFVGDPVVKTQTFDRVALEGVYFSNEHCIAS